MLRSVHERQHRPASTAYPTEKIYDQAEWEVKRDDARSPPQLNGNAPRRSAALEKEWGGEHEVRTYYGTAAAKIIADRLGKHLGKFLTLADKVDAAVIIDHLRASAAARDAAAAQRRSWRG